MQIKVWSNFSKRVNSTKQPTAASATTKDVTLKDMCDILAPSFVLNSTDFDINYVQAFNNYYFAQCTNLDGHRTEIRCSLDHLATFKTQIGAYNGYVQFASSAPASYIYLDDPRNGTTSAVKNGKSSADVGWTTSSAGCYLIAMANAISSGNCGAPAYYLTNATGLSNIVGKIFDQQIINVIEHQFNGVFNSIISCSWLPFDGTWAAGAAGANSFPVYAGSEDLNVGNMAMLSGRTWHNRIYCAIPNDLGYSGTYIQSGKYITATIYLPGVGICPLTYDIYKESQTGVTIDVYLDFVTGDIVYYLSTASAMGSGQSQTFSGNIATKVPVVGASYDGLGVASGILSTSKSIATGDPIGAAEGITGIARSMSLDTMVVGANSSPLSLIHEGKVVIETHTQIPIHGATSAAELEVFRTERGMPYFNNATLSSLSGYIQCADASVSIPGDGAEQDTVNGYLNSGIYYE